MIVSTGVDTIEIERIHALWQRAGERFLQRIFTPAERDYCLSRGRPAASLAARFAAKEAVMKCLGTGWGSGVEFRAIEVVRVPSGAVQIALHGATAEIARLRGIRSIHLSLSHNDHSAIAFAVAEG
jgi:holo-[acyl-carrier protein] synthase